MLVKLYVEYNQVKIKRKKNLASYKVKAVHFQNRLCSW